ncbi:hypothetical protein EAH84_13050 [Sphingomonas oligophenolica]|uniref:Uncharacterized protein n=2 Tax=Sphingomonas oligophenolica TaxID=301154 RepID=A0A502CA24_9SPHN|nr:hypothetical protein EAH84_13050 [Sphingomonas oligophenolica]
MALLFDQQYVDRPDPHLGREHLRVNHEALVDAADALNLAEKTRLQLIEDSQLIAAWYLLPARRSALGLTRSDDLVALGKIAKAAKVLHDTVFTHLDGIEQLSDFIATDDDGSSDDIDFAQFATISGSIAVFANRAIQHCKAPHGGRKSDARRNYALALVVAAAEEATGEKAGSTRGTRLDPQKRFTNSAGQYVGHFFRAVGLNDEQLLVGAFEKISRTIRPSGE